MSRRPLVFGIFFVLSGVLISACLPGRQQGPAMDSAPVRLITLDPGHFHASLVQKTMLPGVDSAVHVYGPAGDDLQEHLARIDTFNNRPADPTHWREIVYAGPDFFDRMLAEKAGNVVVIAGNNARKTDYILRSLQAGLNVLADKPMANTPAELQTLQQAFTTAAQKHLLLYDIMTERYEIWTLLQRALMRNADLFGTLVPGTPDNPAITLRSVHYLKTVAGVPLKRPAWFFDAHQEGEGLVDVGTHLADLIQWEAFPSQTLSPADVQILSARHWTTPLSREQFASVTGLSEFRAFLQPDVSGNTLNVLSNGECIYRLRTIFAHLTVSWEFSAPPGSGDTHYALVKGTRANLLIRQTAAESYKPALYVQPALASGAFEAALQNAVRSLQSQYPGIGCEPAPAAGAGMWQITVPPKYDVGHEAHFAQVTENYLSFLRAGKMPEWETAGMLTKYATLLNAAAIAAAGPSR